VEKLLASMSGKHLKGKVVGRALSILGNIAFAVVGLWFRFQYLPSLPLATRRANAQTIEMIEIITIVMIIAGILGVIYGAFVAYKTFLSYQTTIKVYDTGVRGNAVTGGVIGQVQEIDIAFKDIRDANVINKNGIELLTAYGRYAFYPENYNGIRDLIVKYINRQQGGS